MARKTKLIAAQRSFVGGEISPTSIMDIRRERYADSAKQLRNVYVSPEGYAFRREGLEYVAATTSNQEARLINFEFNNIQTYLLVFTAGEFKVYKDDVLQATVSSAPVSTLTLGQIKEMDFTQSADTLLLVHPDVQPIQIQRTSHTAWTAAYITFEHIPVYAFNGVTVTEPATNHLTLSSASGRDVTITSTHNIFSAASVNQYVIGKKGGILFITQYVSATQVVGDVHVDFPDTSIDGGDWEYESGYEPVWSASRGWPASLTFYQSRLWFGGSKARPQTLWGSKVSYFFNFDVNGSNAADAIDVTLDSDELNAIQRVYPGRTFQIFTTAGEYYIPNRDTEPITPENISVLPATGHGASAVTPVSVDGATIFVQNSGRVIREFVYNDVEKSYNAANVSIYSSHLINASRSLVVRKATSTVPADFVYLLNTDGTIAVFSALRSVGLAAWSLFTTEGEFEDVTVVNEVVYVVVKRTINGSTARYIEKFNEAAYMDASKLSTSSLPTDTWTGYGHLDGETIKVRGDDYILQNVTIASGNFTSSQKVSAIEAGINFSASIETLPIDVDLGGYSMAGQYRRLVSAQIRLHNSRNIQVRFLNNTYEPAFRQFGDLFDSPIQTFSGYKKVYLNGVDREPTITITQTEPLEFIVLGTLVEVK